MKLSRTLAMTVAMATATFTAQAQNKLTYSSWFPAPSVLHSGVLKPYFDRVEKDAPGTKVELFTDSTLAGGRETMGALKGGTIDMGLIAFAYHPGELKNAALITESSLMAKNTFAANAALNELLLLRCTDCVEDFKRQGIRALAVHVSPDYSLLCNKKVATLADLKGKRVRSPSPWSAEISALGGTPVNLSVPETYEALQRGQIDCTMASAGWLTSHSMADVVKFVSQHRWGGVAAGIHVAISDAKWQSLNKEQRRALLMNAGQSALDLNRKFAAEDAASIKQAQAAGKIEFVAPGADLLAASAKYREGEAERVVKLGERRNVKDTDKLVATWQQLLAKWDKVYADVKGDDAAFLKKMNEEIYSKISVD
jgi:TRAP-type C4-dicarboxylate transport system substrate-binding protein